MTEKPTPTQEEIERAWKITCERCDWSPANPCNLSKAKCGPCMLGWQIVRWVARTRSVAKAEEEAACVKRGRLTAADLQRIKAEGAAEERAAVVKWLGSEAESEGKQDAGDYCDTYHSDIAGAFTSAAAHFIAGDHKASRE